MQNMKLRAPPEGCSICKITCHQKLVTMKLTNAAPPSLTVLNVT